MTGISYIKQVFTLPAGWEDGPNQLFSVRCCEVCETVPQRQTDPNTLAPDLVSPLNSKPQYPLQSEKPRNLLKGKLSLSVS